MWGKKLIISQLWSICFVSLHSSGMKSQCYRTKHTKLLFSNWILFVIKSEWILQCSPHISSCHLILFLRTSMEQPREDGREMPRFIKLPDAYWHWHFYSLHHSLSPWLYRTNNWIWANERQWCSICGAMYDRQLIMKGWFFGAHNVCDLGVMHIWINKFYRTISLLLTTATNSMPQAKM